MSKFTRLAARCIVAGGQKHAGLRAAFDVEANGLLDSATTLHCIAIADLDSDRVDEYGPEQIKAGLEHLARADYLTGHNICNYDLPLLHRLYSWAPPNTCTIRDTLVISRLILPHVADLDDEVASRGCVALGKLRGRYCLEAWGLRLGIPKVGTDIEDWSQWTAEMQQRCVGDVAICKALWCFLKPDGYSQQAIELEHRAATICDTITTTGAPFDVAAAAALRQQWAERRAELTAQLQQQFPGTKLSSRKQIGALLEARGWIPEKRTEKTKQAKIDAELLETIPATYPEFAGLAEYMVLGGRLAALATGAKAWCKHIGADNRIHGGLIHIGTPHSRAKHLDPKLAQVPNPKKGSPFGTECRALFHPDNGWVCVTADQSGLQDRGFAHYLHPFDAGTYAQTFHTKEDTHWKTATALELVAKGVARIKDDRVHTSIREGAKRFRYAFLYGAGAARAGRIIYDIARAAHQADSTNALLRQFFGATPRPNEAALKRIGGRLRQKFITATPGLGKLLAHLEEHARKHKWLPGLDGRRVPVRALHSALNFIVTSSEAIICKRWLVRVHDELCARFRYGWDGDAVITLWVHDEIVTCCRPEIADQVGEILVRHAKEPAEFYGFKVPLDAEYKIGRSWAGEPIDSDSTPRKQESGDAIEPQPVTRTDLDEINVGLQREGIKPITINAAIATHGMMNDLISPGKTLCPFHDDHNPSLHIYSDGHYHCFVCGAHGGVEDLPETTILPNSAVASHAATDARNLERSLQLWNAASPITGTLAERYLSEVRKLDLSNISSLDTVLRFHPRCPFDNTVHPCVIALFRDTVTDEAAGIHRIALTPDAEKIGRMMLGSWPNARAIKLKPLGKQLTIGEGIETTIAGDASAPRESALWALGSATAIKKLPPVPGVTKLAILVDHDRHGLGLEAARGAGARWQFAGCQTTLLVPHQAGCDFNDLIKESAS
jgi:DNA polymerase I-like protein with 3'-5' exonuclease and polymerase domains